MSSLLSTKCCFKNFNLYWLLLTLLGVWFLFVYAPPLLMKRKSFLHDVPFALHLVGAYTIYICCMVNTLFTPSTCNGKARPFHVYIGRIGMVAGVVGFVLGAYCSWWPYRQYLPPRAFSIGITIGGLFQVYWQYTGYTAIRKFKMIKKQIQDMEVEATTTGRFGQEELEDLKHKRDEALSIHVRSMVALFGIGCSGPALIRLIALLGFSSLLSLLAAVSLLVFLIRPYSKTFLSSKQQEHEPLLQTDEHPLPSEQTPILVKA